MDRIPPHDAFDAPDVEDEADTRERVLEGGEDAGDGDAERVREELGLEDEPDEPDEPDAKPDPVRRLRRGSPDGTNRADFPAG